jgi:hypothetical protein
MRKSSNHFISTSAAAEASDNSQEMETAASKQQQSETIETVLNIIIYLVQILMLCAPTINAILYGYKNKTIQENIHNIWRKQKTKIELHYEIQARTPSTCGSRKASLTETTTNLPHSFQPQLKRQLSEFFFGTSSSLTSHLNDDMSLYHTSKIYRTPSDSFFHTTPCGRRSSHHEFLSPNFDPLGKMSATNVPANTPSSTNKMNTANIANNVNMSNSGLSHSTSKNLLSNFKKLIVGNSRNDITTPDGEETTGTHFPKILITKHSDSLLNTHSTSRRESDIQQVDEIEEEVATEKEPLLTQHTHSLDNVSLRLSQNARKFQTL